MVNLLTGPKGSGKTQQMIDLANQQAKACSGNVVFIKNSHRDTSSVAFDIRVVCMDDYDAITNIMNISVSCTECTVLITM